MVEPVLHTVLGSRSRVQVPKEGRKLLGDGAPRFPGDVVFEHKKVRTQESEDIDSDDGFRCLVVHPVAIKRSIFQRRAELVDEYGANNPKIGALDRYIRYRFRDGKSDINGRLFLPVESQVFISATSEGCNLVIIPDEQCIEIWKESTFEAFVREVEADFGELPVATPELEFGKSESAGAGKILPIGS